MKPYKTVSAASMTELTINRSRFIGRCFPVSDEGEALAFLADIRKRHYDASHNCFAYRIGVTASTARYSDDGEPGGTAGLPIMEVLSARELTDVLVVVTRYFGGVLLGAGGLVRAYSKSAASSVAAAGAIELLPGRELTVCVDYSRYGALETFLRENAEIKDVAFAENVTLTLMALESGIDALCAEIVERTDGRCRPQLTGEGYMRRALR